MALLMPDLICGRLRLRVKNRLRLSTIRRSWVGSCRRFCGTSRLRRIHRSGRPHRRATLHLRHETIRRRSHRQREAADHSLGEEAAVSCCDKMGDIWAGGQPAPCNTDGGAAG